MDVTTLELATIKVASMDFDQMRSILQYELTHGTGCKSIVPLNLDLLRIAGKNEEFRRICQTSYLVVPDGFGITSLLRMTYGIEIHRITGNDIVKMIIEDFAGIPLNIAVVGSSQQTLDRFFHRVSSSWKNVTLVCLTSPPMNFELDPAINAQVVSQARNAKPDVLLVALGCPRQELWIQKHAATIGARVNIGVGAAIDYYAGTSTRSPVWMQRAGLEWLWRLLREPKRLSKRYLLLDLPFYFREIYLIIFSRVMKHFGR
jgi:N-acetylglucosaminyldiphosphoundecaprenol N-acetyl-beta-D-mannosaminyltransferase